MCLPSMLCAHFLTLIVRLRKDLVHVFGFALSYLFLKAILYKLKNLNRADKTLFLCLAAADKREDNINILQSEFSGDAKKGFLTLIECIRNPPKYFARRLYDTMKVILLIFIVR